MKQLTPSALEKLKQELNDLKDKRKVIARKIEKAQELGDLSENAEYHAAREEQAFIEGKILEIETLIRESVVLESNKDSKNGYITLGSHIKIEYDGKKIEYTIVSFNEADPSNGKISNESPLGKAFLGRREGDILEIKVPAGVMKCKILRVQ